MAIFLKGIIIGVGFVMPGVSGGALAVILGIYERILISIKNIRKNWIFLGILFLGILLGSILFSKLLLFLLESRETFIKYLFIGIIIGSIPSFLKEIKYNKNNFKIHYVYLVISFLISLFLFLIENKYVGFSFSYSRSNTVFMFISGIIYAFGKIVPGVSGSALMMLLGLYKYLLNLLASPFNIDFLVFKRFIPFILGAIIGLIILYKLLLYLINYHYSKTYSAILGFVIGSILFIYPGINIVGIIGMVLSGILTYLITK